MGGPLRVRDGGGERATFARGRWTLRLSSVFCEAGVDARGGVDSGSLAEVGVMGTTGEWRVREERFVGERMVPLSQALWPLGAAPTSCFVT